MFSLTPEHEDTLDTAQKPFLRQNKVQSCRLPRRISLTLSLTFAEAFWLVNEQPTPASSRGGVCVEVVLKEPQGRNSSGAQRS